MRLSFVRPAQKELLRLNKGQPKKAAEIRRAIGAVAADPFAKHNNVKPLQGLKDGYRLQVGDWRVCYTVDRVRDVLEVFEVRTRGGAYR